MTIMPGKLSSAELSLQRARHLLQNFVIADPMKTVLKDPEFRPSIDGYNLIMTLNFRAPDANGGGTIDVNFGKHCPHEAVTDPDKFHNFLRGMLHEALIHEADESIMVDGRRIFDPHRGETR